MDGLFISFEGIDGVGKTTQVDLLADFFRRQGREVLVTREPGGTELGARIRAMLLSTVDKERIGDRAEALLFAADRAQHVDLLIRPALARGAVVITDRYIDSSLAYQAGGRELTVEDVRMLSTWATADLWPARTYLLDLDPRVAGSRMHRDLDRMESEGLAFQERTRAEFLKLAANEPGRYRVLDAARPADELAREICADARSLVG
ncbi:MAG: dTMP kinase [Bifidobacterium sp.]|nr:dTMP kinase [Bifidobacterium sp.]